MNEEKITNLIIEEFNNLDSTFRLKKVEKSINCINYKYDIEVIKDNNTVAIIEAKKRFETSRPTTDAMFASMTKLLYEFIFNFQKNNINSPKLVFLFYIEDPKFKVNNTFRNKIFFKFTELINTLSLDEKVIKFEIINLNIYNLESQIKTIVNNLNKELVTIV